jgi:hypothetical protein
MDIEEEKELKKFSRGLDLLIYWTILFVKFLIGFWFCVIATIPFTFFLHLYYIEKYGSFFMVTMLDFYLLAISNIIFWIKIHFDNRGLKN